MESRCKSFHWANIEDMTLEDFDKHTAEEYIMLAESVSENLKAMKFYENNDRKKVVEEGEPGERYWVMVYE
ncbi:hypothetical protein ABNB59_08445 [Paenibacillus larvae]|nr:hypothetical protein [Paenibacillus larvae]AQR78456.1 hypothetical protein BXP28_15250 [Paenibacillus larvae subsp. larvae]MCY7478869.1 hypothetical protein [Paenibacillus larvae]MCY7490590.1 hypothetical protein [Paenibacillus larvae]MCY9512246.1 hypothetical protein [Paenibacillus larvae]MCY9527357.1 hypothetical protein [Paenibacillus larvae]